MKHLLTIDPDNIANEKGFKERQASRALVTDNEGKIALLHARTYSYYKLPGGGVEEGEDFVEALRRECLEEIGCTIEVLGELGIIEEYRKTENLYQISYCYYAKVIGEKGTPDFTESEIKNGVEVVWVEKEKAIALIQGSELENGLGSSVKLRETTFIEEFLKI